MPLAVLSNFHWTERAPIPLPRAGYMAGAAGGKLVIAGGSYWRDGKKYWSDRTDYFDPLKNEWQPGPSLSQPWSDAACATFHDAIYTFGGGNQGIPTAEVWRLRGNQWTKMEAPMPQQRLYAVAATMEDAVYVTGGLSKAGDYASASNSVWMWKPSAPASAWHELAPIPGPLRVSHAVAALGRKLYVFGGVTMDGSALRNLDDAYVYDLATSKWMTLPRLPVARRAWPAVAVGGRILLCGGYTTDFSADVFEFDPKTNAIVKAAPLPHPIADAKFVLAGSRVLTAGGESGVKIRGIWTIEGDIH
jgi:N-acetylneuraminic acid mutarotase